MYQRHYKECKKAFRCQLAPQGGGNVRRGCLWRGFAFGSLLVFPGFGADSAVGGARIVRADYAPGGPLLSMRLRPNQAERLFRRHHVTPLVISLNGKQQPGQGNQNGNSAHHCEQAAHRRA